MAGDNVCDLAQLAEFARQLSAAIESGECPLENDRVSVFLEAFAGALEDAEGRCSNTARDPDSVGNLQKIAEALGAATIYD